MLPQRHAKSRLQFWVFTKQISRNLSPRLLETQKLILECVDLLAPTAGRGVACHRLRRSRWEKWLGIMLVMKCSNTSLSCDDQLRIQVESHSQPEECTTVIICSPLSSLNWYRLSEDRVPEISFGPIQGRRTLPYSTYSKTRSI